LYIRDYAASIIRPILELKAFEKVKLKAGETKEITFTLSKNDLSFFDANGNTVLEPGKFSVFIGPNSKEVKKADFELK
jgi:beta-glucosidase